MMKDPGGVGLSGRMKFGSKWMNKVQQFSKDCV